MTIDSVLERASAGDFGAYDPTPVIEAVNALVALGQDGALAALDKFLASRNLDDDPHRGLFLVLRTAFETESHPPMRLGGSALSAPPAPALPRFPVMLVDDVPVMLIGGYILGGMAEPVTAHLEYYRKNGKLRAAPLAPKRGTDRAADFAKAYQAAYGAPPAADVRELVEAQLARVKL